MLEPPEPVAAERERRPIIPEPCPRFPLTASASLRLVATMLLVFGAVGCERRDRPPPPAVLHPLSIRVHPDNAVVTLQELGANGPVLAVIQKSGPLASFRLSEGGYRYDVVADGYEPFQGSLAIPQNRNLEVWLTPRGP